MTEVIAWALVGVLLAMIAVLQLAGRSRRAPGDRFDRRSEPEGTVEREIVERSREGVIVLGHSLTPVMANPAARTMLGLASEGLPPTIRSDELESLARRALAEESSIEAEATLWPRRITVRVRAMPLDPYGVALLLEDVTQDAQLQQIRRQFVVNASHELKTPVTGLLALGEAVRDALPNDVAGAERLTDQLVREGERLTKLSQDLLDLSRVEDPSTLRTARVSLAEIARHEATQMKSLGDDHGVTIEPVFDGAGFEVNGDEQQLGLMVRNLIDNAIRYSEAGARVRVEVRTDGHEVLLSVRDEGIGIPKRDQARVFERFYRVDEGRSRSSGGTGLGLSIVRHVAEAHAGHVSVTSELGEGSEFIVRLPLVPKGEK